MNDRRRPGPRGDAIFAIGEASERAGGACGARSWVLACGEPRDDGVWFGPDSVTLPRRLDAGVGGAAGGAVVHDLLVAGVGQVLAAPEDREGLVELVLGIEIEAGIGR